MEATVAIRVALWYMKQLAENLPEMSSMSTKLASSADSSALRMDSSFVSLPSVVCCLAIILNGNTL